MQCLNKIKLETVAGLQTHKTDGNGNTNGEFIDGHSSDRRRVSTQLTYEHQLVEVPDNTRAIATAAHDDVVRSRCSQARHRLTVTKQGFL